MNEWERVFLLWPRKVDGRWRWLSTVERSDASWGCAFAVVHCWEYRSC
jgi:hypothetical protein